MDIQDAIEEGNLSFTEIAAKFGVTYEDVNLLATELREQYEYEDSMDGDHDSAMASAGFGTDEDYGYYGDDE